MNQILVVEDEAVIRAALRRLLERHEYRVSEAGSVKESLEKYDMDAFIIISDLRLPGAPGTDLIKATNAGFDLDQLLEHQVSHRLNEDGCGRLYCQAVRA